MKTCTLRVLSRVNRPLVSISRCSKKDGVDPREFASLLISSGLVCDDEVKWIAGHAGYDFGCLLKLLICKPMPDEQTSFVALVRKFFPVHYDLKYLTRISWHLYQNGTITSSEPKVPEVIKQFEPRPQQSPSESNKLDMIAEAMKIKRTGTAHLAGSDSLLTGKVFFYIRDSIHGGEIPEECNSKIWGLANWDLEEPTNQSTSQQYGQQQENATPGTNGATFNNASPSTPVTSNAALSTTPAHALGGAMGPLTPSGVGGVFGNFTFQKQ